MDSKNVSYKHQYGFRPKNSIIHQILHLLSNDCAINNNSSPTLYDVYLAS